ncbi:hypothetical protein DFQ27_001108, partial [Actinomortierella ambigua]
GTTSSDHHKQPQCVSKEASVLTDLVVSYTPLGWRRRGFMWRRVTAAIQSEVEILKPLAYRHITQFYGTTHLGGMRVLIMEDTAGGSLQHAITYRKLPDWPTKTRIAQEIARGLACIHHEGDIH